MMQMETLRSLCDKRNRQILQEDSTTKPSTDFITNFMREIENTDRKVKEKILSLNLASQELIQLVIFTSYYILNFTDITIGIQSDLYRRGTEIHIYEQEYETTQLDHCKL
jgi:hypothetical protein